MVWLYRTAVVALLMLAPVCGHAQDGQHRVGGVADVRGRAEAEREASEPLLLAVQDAVLRADLLRTYDDSQLTVALDDGSWFSMDADTQARMADYVAGQHALLTMAKGRLRVFVSETFSRSDNAFRVQTDDAVIGVQGTFFIVTRLIAETTLYVIQGIVSVTSTDPRYPDPVIARAGQFVRIPANAPPSPPVTIDQNLDFAQTTNPYANAGQYWGRTLPPAFVVPVPIPVPGAGSGLVDRAIIRGTTPPPPVLAPAPRPAPPPPAGGAAAPAAPGAAGGAAAPAGRAAPAAPAAGAGGAAAAGAGGAAAAPPPANQAPPPLPSNRPGPPPQSGKDDASAPVTSGDSSSDAGDKPPEG